MRHHHRIAATTVASLAIGLVLIPAAPASAAVTATASGTTITVDMVGASSVAFACTAATARVNGTATSPAVACSALTQVTVNADGAAQQIDGRGLDAAAFTAKPHVDVASSGGQDFVWGTAQADSIATGAGNDFITIGSGVPDTSILAGTEVDTVSYYGTSKPQTIGLVSPTGTTLTIQDDQGTGVVSHLAQQVERVRVYAGDGNDTVSAASIAIASSIENPTLEGEGGSDTLTAGPAGAVLWGGTGTNVLQGAGANDVITSSSDADQISQGLGTNLIIDQDSLHAGRPNLQNTGTGNTYEIFNASGDGVVRVRDEAGGGYRFTASLDRTGQGVVPSTFTDLEVYMATAGNLDDRALGDVVATSGGRATAFIGDNADDDLLDVTVPSGSWTVTGTPDGVATVDPANAAYGTVTASNVGSLRVHGDWADANQSFSHRVVRDLLFRFLGDTDRENARKALADGVTTRPQVTASLMGTDEYRGLDVDRTFVKYLRRKADSGGRSYWINSIRNGKALWRFRAQLFGSNEYFTKAGATNAAYVAKAYEDVLGRAPDPSGKAYWTNKLNNGADRGSVALQFINSPEARRRLVDDQFLRFLDRKPTTGEQTTWVDELPGATGEQDLIAYLVNSGAYYNRS